MQIPFHTRDTHQFLGIKISTCFNFFFDSRGEKKITSTTGERNRSDENDVTVGFDLVGSHGPVTSGARDGSLVRRGRGPITRLESGTTRRPNVSTQVMSYTRVSTPNLKTPEIFGDFFNFFCFFNGIFVILTSTTGERGAAR